MNKRWSHLPNNVLNDRQPESGIILPGGRLHCRGCTRTFDDGREPADMSAGRKPSCPFCWVALECFPGLPAAGQVPADLEGAQVKLIVFDMGHVFVDFDWGEVCKGFMAKSLELSREDVDRAMAYLSSLGYERGAIGTQEFLRQLNCSLGTTLSLAEFRAIWTSTFQENPEMALLLERLAGRQPLYLLSNTNEAHYNYLQESFNVARHFQELILSYEMGCSKPEPRIYEEVLKRSGLPAENVLFVDDMDANVKAATSLGMQGIQFTGIESLKRDLNLLGIEV